MFKAEDTEPFQEVLDWVHSIHGVNRKDNFHQVVANSYSRARNQCIRAHTDQNDLLGETADILSLSLGAAGLFYCQPNDKKRRTRYKPRGRRDYMCVSR